MPVPYNCLNCDKFFAKGVYDTWGKIADDQCWKNPPNVKGQRDKVNDPARTLCSFHPAFNMKPVMTLANAELVPKKEDK